jgi:hypothetical protein
MMGKEVGRNNHHGELLKVVIEIEFTDSGQSILIGID